MDEVQKDVLGVLLRTLLDRGLISGDVYDKARGKILGALDLTPFFRNEEDANGSSQNPR